MAAYVFIKPLKLTDFNPPCRFVVFLNNFTDQLRQTNIALVGKTLQIPLNVKVPIDKLVVRIINFDGQFLKEAPLYEKEYGQYVIDFLADQIGDYVLDIMIGGELKTRVPVLVYIISPVLQVQNSTTSIEMRDTEEATTYVGSEFEYTLELPADIPVQNLRATFVHALTGEPEHTYIMKADRNNIVLKFVPSKEGKYTASVEISGQGANGKCSVGSQHVFGISVEGMDVNGIGAMIQTPQGDVHAATISVTGSNTLDISYIPETRGEYLLELVYEGGTFSGPLKLIAE